VLEAAFDVIVRNALAQPRRFVHRDFHSRNLLVTDARNPGGIAPGLLSPGILDFQGALHGPVTYDLASLLRDAYIAWPRERVEGWVESYRLCLRRAGVIGDEVDAPRFLRWFDLTGLHRHVRVLGQFYRLWYRDGKPGYLADLPRTLDYVREASARYRELGALARFLEERVCPQLPRANARIAAERAGAEAGS
jgi:aminoglycoside/choline kinase family phosphotransferase